MGPSNKTNNSAVEMHIALLAAEGGRFRRTNVAAKMRAADSLLYCCGKSTPPNPKIRDVASRKRLLQEADGNSRGKHRS